jgi:rhodanese-related sulfurtransferase
LKTILTTIIFMMYSSTLLAQGFADESKDWGLPPKDTPKSWPYTGNTPLTIPGAKTIGTQDLKNLIKDSPKLHLIDVLGEKKMIAGAISMAGIGTEFLKEPLKDKFEKALATLTGNDKSIALVFYCHHSRCRWSYNASLHALALGYRNIYWYRGGIDAWTASGAETVTTTYVTN